MLFQVFKTCRIPMERTIGDAGFIPWIYALKSNKKKSLRKIVKPLECKSYMTHGISVLSTPSGININKSNSVQL